MRGVLHFFWGLILSLLLASCGDDFSSGLSNDRTDALISSPDYLLIANDLYELGEKFRNTGHDSLHLIGDQLASLGEANLDPKVTVKGKLLSANYKWMRVNYPEAIKLAVEALEIAQNNGLKTELPAIYATIGNLYKENEN